MDNFNKGWRFTLQQILYNNKGYIIVVSGLVHTNCMNSTDILGILYKRPYSSGAERQSCKL